MQALLLDDDESTRTLYGECITGAGHKVIECDTLESAYAALRTHRIDVLVLDLVIGDTTSATSKSGNPSSVSLVVS